MRRASSLPWRVLLGLRRPRETYRVPGSEYAGEVESVGTAVRSISVGQRVFGIRRGANAEYICVKETGMMVPMPSEATFEEAASLSDGFFQAQRALRRGKVTRGTRLLVYGASGSCGTAAVQLAKHLGAEVTAVCNADNVELVRSLGPDNVIDYQSEDFTTDDKTYDVLLDAVGKLSFMKTRHVVRPGGLWVATDGLLNVAHAFWSPWFGKRRLVSGGIQRGTREDLLQLRGLVEAGEYRAVIDHVYPLHKVVEAHRRVESWQKTGNVVLSLQQG
jgi:NADPH2:quinone reductase